MVTPFTIYLLFLLDGLEGIALAGFLVALLGSVICAASGCAAAGDLEEDIAKKYFTTSLTSGKIAIVSLIVFVLIPSTNQALFMFGVPMLLNSQQEAIAELGETPSKTLKLLNEYLEDELSKRRGEDD